MSFHYCSVIARIDSTEPKTILTDLEIEITITTITRSERHLKRSVGHNDRNVVIIITKMKKLILK